MANEEEEYIANLVTLVDDDGQEHEFEIVDDLERGDDHYVALVASNDDPDDQEDDGELVILKSVMDGEEEFLEAIEDEAEFDEIAAIFMERLEDSFDFTDDDKK